MVLSDFFPLFFYDVVKSIVNHPFGNGTHTTYKKYSETVDSLWHCSTTVRDNDDSPCIFGVFPPFSGHGTRWQTRQHNKRRAMRQPIQGLPSWGLRLGVEAAKNGGFSRDFLGDLYGIS